MMRRAACGLCLIAASGWWVPVPAAAAQEAAPAKTLPDVIEMVIDEQQTLAFPDLLRYVAGDSTLLGVEQLGATTLRLTAKAAGRTFLHVWTSQGRITRPVRLLYHRLVVLPPERLAPPGAIQHAEPLKIGYDAEYEFTGRGGRLSTIDQATTNALRQTVTHRMETPFGLTSSLVGFNRVNSFIDLTTWQANLQDGDLGWFEEFDLTAGDTAVSFANESFGVPSTGFRGVSLTYRDVDPLTTGVVWGRERVGVVTPLRGTDAIEQDAFLYGFNVACDDPSAAWASRVSALFGYGEDRGPSQSSHVIDVGNRLRLFEPWWLESEVALSEGVIGYTIGSSWNWPRVGFVTRFRDVPEDFQTITGASGSQGQRGVQMNGRWNLTDALSLRGGTDVYRNRLFPNPAEPDTLNLDAAAGMDWHPWPKTTVSGFVNRSRHLGLISPSDDLRSGIQWSESVPVHRLLPWMPSDALLSARWEHQDSRTVNAPSLDFTAEVLSLGVSLPLGCCWAASAGQQWNVLKETSTGNRSQPRRFTTALAYFSNLGPGYHWQLRGRVGYENEEQTGATRSLLAGQDRLVGEAGLRHRPSEDREYFVDGRIEQVMAEGSTQQDFVELAVFTGVRMLFDTRVMRWDPAMQIAGSVFHDLNGDGLRQPDEEGLGGIRVKAGVARETMTDRTGRFLFGRVGGKVIPVSLDVSTLPTGFTTSTPATHTLRPGEGTPAPLLFGVIGRAEIRGRVFYDVDADGEYGSADRGIDGVRLQLDHRIATTDRSGWFFFRELPGGRYTISLILETLPLRYLPQVPVRRSLEAREGGIVTIDVPVAVSRTLEGRAFVDRDQNRQFDAVDEALRGLPVCLDGRRAATTNAQGVFQFGDVALGTHELALNCGMPMPEFVSLTGNELRVSITPEGPERVTVDFRLERKQWLLDEMLRERGPSEPARPSSSEEDVTEL
jgi:hypothetical protein